MTASSRMRRLGAAALCAGLLAGCATTGSGNPRDPLEPLNRAIFGFNEAFDRALMKPVAEGYRAILPEMLRAGATNFFSNIEDLWSAANNLLQCKPEQALQDVMRVAMNTVIGLGGLIDVASDAGLDKHSEDFGQTLGRWGVGSGPYLVLPFLGPSSLRDGIGLLAVDYAADPVWNADHIPTRNTLYAGRAVNSRANALDAGRVLEDAALDKYRFMRDSYLQRRRNLVYDGDPPREREQDADEPSSALPPARSASTTGAESETAGNDMMSSRSDPGALIAYPGMNRM